MIRRLLIPLLGSGLLLAASASSVFAKCEGPNPPAACNDVLGDLRVFGGGYIHAGTLETVMVEVSKGEQPFEAVSVLVVFTSEVDATTIRVPAIATLEAGIWSAKVTLPNGGLWSVEAQVVDASGSATMVPLQTVHAGQLPAPPPVATPVAPPPVTPTTPVLPIALVVAGLAAAGLAGQAIRDRSRRRTAGATAAAAPAALPGESAATPDRA